MSIDILLPGDREKYLAAKKVKPHQRNLNQRRCIIFCEAMMKGYSAEIAMQIRDKEK